MKLLSMVTTCCEVCASKSPPRKDAGFFVPYTLPGRTPASFNASRMFKRAKSGPRSSAKATPLGSNCSCRGRPTLRT